MLETVRGSPDDNLEHIRRLVMPAHHDVRSDNVDLHRLGAVLALAHERELSDFASLLLVEGLGPRTLQSLALVAEVIHGAPTRFSDPARFSFAHGGKDGHPFPVPLKTYDETISFMRRSLEAAKVGHSKRSIACVAWIAWCRLVEQKSAPRADFDAVVAHEQSISPSLEGRVVRPRRWKASNTLPTQMHLF